MGPLDRPSIQRLVDGHKARGEDPWLLVAGLYAKVKAYENQTPQVGGCDWATYTWGRDSPVVAACDNPGMGEDVHTADDLALIFLDRHHNPNINLCYTHWQEIEARFRRIAKPVYEQVRNAEYKRRDSEAAVYFMRRADGCIKIGFSSQVGKRAKQLEEIHGPLDILHTEKGGRNRESALHNQFKAARVEGEWFRPVPELLMYLGAVPV